MNYKGLQMVKKIFGATKDEWAGDYYYITRNFVICTYHMIGLLLQYSN
jgi:ferritin-like protein